MNYIRLTKYRTKRYHRGNFNSNYQQQLDAGLSDYWEFKG